MINIKYCTYKYKNNEMLKLHKLRFKNSNYQLSVKNAISKYWNVQTFQLPNIGIIKYLNYQILELPNFRTVECI